MNLEQQQYIEKLTKQRANFEAKMRMVYNEGNTRHSHAEISDWLKCFHCMLARKNQMEAKRKIGMDNPRNYMKWRKRNTLGYDDRLRRAQENIYKF
mgnify:CR=1 FL=1